MASKNGIQHGKWECGICTYHNLIAKSKCEICEEPRVKKEDADVRAYGYVPYGKWVCTNCTLHNHMSYSNCQVCTEPKEKKGLDRGKKGLGKGYGNFYQPAYSSHSSNDFMTSDKELRIAIIGRTGAGKSATANTILGREMFRSELTSCSVTKVCKMEIGNVEGRKLIVVDTPGLFDTGMDNVTVTKEIVNCVGMIAPGPHAIILVVGVGRFTKEEQDTLNKFKETFGEHMGDYLIVLFTNKDQLDLRGQSIKEFVGNAQPELKQIIGECKNRYIAFNNIGTPDEKRRHSQELIRLIDRMLRDNGGMCYTSELFKEAEANFKRKAAELRKKHEAEKKKETDAIKQKCELKHKAKEKEYNSEIKHLKEEKEKDNETKNLLEGNIKMQQDEAKKVRIELQKERQQSEQQIRQEKEKHQQQITELKGSQLKEANEKHAKEIQIMEMEMKLKVQEANHEATKSNEATKQLCDQLKLLTVRDQRREDQMKISSDKNAECIRELQRQQQQDLQRMENKHQQTLNNIQDQIRRSEEQKANKSSCSVM